MSEYIKRKSDLGIAKETTRGTKATPTFWLKPTSNDIQDRIEVVKSDRQFGRIEARDDQAVAKTWSQGTIEGEIFDRSFGLFLLAGLGKVTTSPSGDSGVYNHLFEVLQSSQHPTLTIVEKRFDVEQIAYVNSVIETLGLTFELNNYCTFSANIKGKAKVADTSTPSYEAENFFMAKNATVKIADDVAGLSAGTTLCAKNLTLEITKNVQDDECLGNATPTDFLNQDFSVVGEIELYFDSIYNRDFAINQIKKAMRITLEDTNVTIGATSHPKLVLDFAKVKFEEPEISSEANEITRLVLKFEAFYSEDDEFLIKATLSNTEASY